MPSFQRIPRGSGFKFPFFGPEFVIEGQKTTYTDTGGGGGGGSENLPPIADFTADNNFFIGPKTINFTDLSLHNPTAWSWDFGDGGSSTEQNPSHDFDAVLQDTVYTVSLTVTNAYGQDTAASDIYMEYTAADFTYSPTIGAGPLLVSFDSNSHNVPQGTLWEWDFGDGNNDSGIDLTNTIHEYASVISTTDYTATLTLTNDNGQYSASHSVTVGAPPVAAFNAVPNSGESPLLVQFTDTSTNNPTSWVWDFGDLGSSTLQNPSHTFTAGESTLFTVTLTVSNPYGQDTTTSDVSVSSPP